jgi:hypothetical protein
MKNKNNKNEIKSSTSAAAAAEIVGSTATSTLHRGRPFGATSTLRITAGKLLELVGGDKTAEVEVGRAWLKKFKLAALSKTVDAELAALTASAPAPAPAAQEAIEFTES